MKAMLSQPMADKTEEEIVATRERAIKALEAQGYEIVNTLFTDEWYQPENMKQRGVENIPLCFLAKSLENMSKCHAAYFCRGWECARGCLIEHAAASNYGLTIIIAGKELGMGRQKVKPDSWRIPQRYERCCNCVHVKRFGQYNNKFNCEKYYFVTEPHALCDDFEMAKDRKIYAR